MKNTAASGAKTPLFDRIFKPEVITLENGHTVTRPRSRTPLIALLVKHDVPILECSWHHQSLEQYFFHKNGGERDVESV